MNMEHRQRPHHQTFSERTSSSAAGLLPVESSLVFRKAAAYRGIFQLLGQNYTI